MIISFLAIGYVEAIGKKAYFGPIFWVWFFLIFTVFIGCVCCCVYICEKEEEDSSTEDEPPENSDSRNESELLQLVEQNTPSAPIAVGIGDDLPPSYKDAYKY